MFSYGVRLVSMAVSVITLIGSPVFPVAAAVVAAPPPDAAVVAAPPLDAAVVAAPAAAVVAAAVVAVELLLLSPPHAAATNAAATSTTTKAPRRRILKPALIFSVPPCVRDTPSSGRPAHRRAAAAACQALRNSPQVPAARLRPDGLSTGRAPTSTSPRRGDGFPWWACSDWLTPSSADGNIEPSARSILLRTRLRGDGASGSAEMGAVMPCAPADRAGRFARPGHRSWRLIPRRAPAKGAP